MSIELTRNKKRLLKNLFFICFIIMYSFIILSLVHIRQKSEKIYENLIDEAVAYQLKKSPEQLTKKDFETLETFSITGLTTEGLKHLKKLRNLKTLNIYSSKELFKRPQNKWIVKLRSLLRVPESSKTKLIYIGSLKNLRYLQHLSLSNSNVADIKPLEQLKYLQDINLSKTQIKDIKALKKLTYLKSLNINDTRVYDISPIANLKNLEYIGLNRTNVVDLSPLAELKNLQTIDIRNTQINDIGQLSNLKSLKTIYLNKQISAEQISELQEALPGLKIQR